jgi:phosphohistidine phosphatase
MLNEIILLRHGESVDKQIGQTDFDRILSEQGRNSITQLGLFFKSEKIIPDYILSSDAKRAKQTAQTLADALSFSEASISYEPALYLGLDLHYRDSILKLKDSINVLVVVGHNPSISSLCAMIVGDYSKALQPGQAAIIKLKSPNEEIGMLKGTLLKFVGPFIP